MTAKQQLEACKAKGKQLNERLAPLNAAMAEKHAELSRLRETVATAERNRDAAIERAATVSGMQLLGAANADAARDAIKARAEAETAFADAQAHAATIHALTIEIAALQGVGAELATGLVATAKEQDALTEQYLRECADTACAEYAQGARELAARLANVLAWNQLLATANCAPDLLLPGTWSFAIPALGSPTANGKGASGLLVDIETARLQQPKAFADIRQRVAADGVAL